MLRSYLDAWTMDDEDEETNHEEDLDQEDDGCVNDADEDEDERVYEDIDVYDDDETDDEDDLDQEDDGCVIDADEDEDERVYEDVDVYDDDDTDDEDLEENDGRVIDADEDEDERVDIAVDVDDEDDDETDDEEPGEGEGMMDAAPIEPSRRRPRKNYQSPKLVPEWCFNCNRLFPSIFKFKTHLAKRRCPPFDVTCIGCNATFQHASDRRRHEQNCSLVNPAGNVVRCDICNDTFTRQDALSRHLNQGRCQGRR